MADFSAEQRERYLPLCPDFIIEVRSRNDSLKMLKAKMQTWMDNGALLAWMIDPYGATLTIYRRESDPETLTRPDFAIGENPVAGFRLNLSNIWA